jgi:hypothetical protein
MTRTRPAPFVFLALERDGRLTTGNALDRIRTRLASAAPPITDAFVFCLDWLEEPAEAKIVAARFFSMLQGWLALLRDRVAPLRIALHWPSRPFAEGPPACVHTDRCLPHLVERQIPLGPEEEAELDALLRRPPRGHGPNGERSDPDHAFTCWVTKKRAGEVGERFGREHLAPLWAECPPARRPRLHLIGHSFGARLLTSAVLGGARPQSLTLLQAAFSAFAFAEEVPGFRAPGFYHRILADRRVAGRIVCVRAAPAPALITLYPILRGASRVARPGRLGRTREVVAASAMGVAGARGVGAPEVEILEAQRLGLPLRPIVNVDASRVIITRQDILHPDVAAIILLASGLLVGGLDGPRPRSEGP